MQHADHSPQDQPGPDGSSAARVISGRPSTGPDGQRTPARRQACFTRPPNSASPGCPAAITRSSCSSGILTVSTTRRGASCGGTAARATAASSCLIPPGTSTVAAPSRKARWCSGPNGSRRQCRGSGSRGRVPHVRRHPAVLRRARLPARLPLYRGATIDDPVNGMYSFVPARPAVSPPYPRFERPEVQLTRPGKPGQAGSPVRPLQRSHKPPRRRATAQNPSRQRPRSTRANPAPQPQERRPIWHTTCGMTVRSAVTPITTSHPVRRHAASHVRSCGYGRPGRRSA